MSRWINADAMIRTLGVSDEDINFREILDSAPSIDIVRCKECYMCDEEMWCSFYDSIMESDDFCSYGERREP